MFSGGTVTLTGQLEFQSPVGTNAPLFWFSLFGKARRIFRYVTRESIPMAICDPVRRSIVMRDGLMPRPGL